MMEKTTYFVDGQTLVDNIHSIKQWVYAGLIRIYVPNSSVETVETLHKKSLEAKEASKDDRQQKRQSGRPRKEQPLFDINPRTAQEFLERAKSEDGMTGVSFQQASGEEFTQWKEEDEKATAPQPLAPPSSFSEALLRKLNISQPEDNAGSEPHKPKLVAKSVQPKNTPFKYHKVPTIKKQDIPNTLQSYFSAVLWKAHEAENNPLEPESLAILVQDLEMEKLVKKVEVFAVRASALRLAIQEKLARDDVRDQTGMIEVDFPDVPRRDLPPRKTIAEPPSKTNGHPHTYEEIGQRLQATTTSTIEALLKELTAGNVTASTESVKLPEAPSAELRPSFSYAMAAGAKSNVALKPASPTPLVVEPQQHPLPVSPGLSPAHVEDRNETVKASEPDDEPSSDEEVVLFVGKKRRSQDVNRGVNRPVSRPTTATGPDKIASPKPARAVLGSTLKPQSPVFTPGQLYTPSSPVTRPISEAYPTPVSKDNSPTRRSSPPKRETGSSPNVRGKTHIVARGSRIMSGQGRSLTSDDALRQGEMILQRQREAIKRTAQLQQAQAAQRAEQEANTARREIEMSPTATPVVIDPDEFGRDYTIRASTAENGNPRGKGSMRRGRGRGGKMQAQPVQPNQQDTERKDIDFVLKTGAPRGSARGRGRGKLWVP